MAALLILRIALVLALLLSIDSHAAQSVPQVYQDEYVAIRSGVAEIGLRPIHLGDALSFIIELEFDGSQVRVESLDEDFFLRTFASSENISMHGSPLITHEDRGERHIMLRASWPFQILGCPDGLADCRGDKHYQLPVITISYQLIDDAAAVVNDKSVRFRPRPGSLAVVSALASPHGPAGEFLDYFPGGAHPDVLLVEGRRAASLAAIIAGVLLLVVGFNNRSPQHMPAQRAAQSHAPANRWEHALASLRNDSMPDDQWADLLRRCASWYCLDELGLNPHQESATEFGRFFAELSELESIGSDQRAEHLGRFIRLSSGEST